MSADQRAVLAFDAHLAYMRWLTEVGGGTVVERNGALVLRSLHPAGFLVNACARRDTRTLPETVLAAAAATFDGRGYELLCLGDRDADLLAAGARAGLAPDDSPAPLQYLDHAPLASPADRHDLELRVVSDERGMADVVAVNSDAYSVYGFPPDFYEVILARPASLIGEDITAFVCYAGDEPVATAQLFCHAGLAYVGWVGVATNTQRRGLGWLVTETVVRSGLEQGARAAVLIASAMGAPLYRKMGFVDVGEVSGLTAAPAA